MFKQSVAVFDTDMKFKYLMRAVWPDVAFGMLLSATIVGTFELFYDLWDAGLVKHPIFSTVFPFFVHHMYFFEVLLFPLWLMARGRAYIKIIRKLTK